jgi:membrane-associated protease RseP (regulator of RpoE activity)
MLSPPLPRTVSRFVISALPWVVALGVGASVHLWSESTRTITVVHVESCPERIDRTEFFELARFVPSQGNHGIRGLKLYGIRGGSPLRELGFHNGDLLTHIDGEAVDSLQRAIELVESASTVSVTVVRRGQTRTEEIPLRPDAFRPARSPR